MATIGDPLMDLGNSLAYGVEAGDSEEMQVLRLMLTHIPGALTRAELVAAYGKERLGH
jgi:aminoglycoside phosphotransferase (APT) family kinase protein